MKLTHVGLAGAVAAFVLSGVSDFDRTAVRAEGRAAAATPGSETPKAAPPNKDRIDEQDGHKEAPPHKTKHPRRHHDSRFDTDDMPEDDEGETALACN